MPHIPGHTPTPLTRADVGEALRPVLQQQQTLDPLLQGTSPLTQAAIEQFKQAQLPIIQGQMALQGLSGSPALSVATAQGLGQALPQFIGQDIQNRLQAAQLGLGSGQLGLQEEIQRGQLGVQQRGQALQEFTQPFGLGLEQRRVGLQEFAVPEQLAQSGAGLVANIANQQKARELQAAQQAGNLSLGFASQVAIPAAQLETQRQLAGIQGLSTLGGQQQQIQQQGFDAQQAERARLQQLASIPSLGLFGGAGISPAIGAAAQGK